MAAPRSAIPLTAIFETCEKLYARDGFVKWADVGKVHGLSRQAIQLRLKAALQRGELDQATHERWMSMSARAATSRERRRLSREADAERQRARVQLVLTPENEQWLRRECIFRKMRSIDIINGLITKAREASE